MMETDFIINGQPQGNCAVADLLAANNMDPLSLRPYMDIPGGQSYINRISTFNSTEGTFNVETVPTHNAATLTYDAWKSIDNIVIQAAQERLRVVSDLESRGLVYNIQNALGTPVLISQTASDISDADLSMDARRSTAADRQEFDTTTLPLPIAHKDFHFNIREINAVNNGGLPIDSGMIELAGRKVAETVEKLVLGVYGTYQFGGGNVYGLANHTDNNTKNMTTPTGSNGETTITEILDMITKAQADNHYGPFVIYAAPSWAPFLDSDYSTSKGDGTLLERIKKISSVQDVIIADHMTTKTMLLVQTTSNVVQVVNGIDFMTVQWDTLGGMQKNFKVMALKVPRVRSEFGGKSGIVLGTYT
ncbi:MAG: bacteriocin family protein [FCB group bacterium]|nr:bacteriocin family protein [FCB group bacterium]